VSFTLDASTACAGTSKEALKERILLYNYNFVTNGTDVVITFELLDTDKTYLVLRYIFRRQINLFLMSNPSGQIYKATLTGRTVGATLRFAVRGAYAGGLVTSN
jgi:hypothetical protein